MKVKKEIREAFNRNFNPDVFEEVKKPIKEIVENSTDFMDMWHALNVYENNGPVYFDDFDLMVVYAELDPTRLNTVADYVGVFFIILWYNDISRGLIDAVELYSTENKVGEYFADYICTFDPDSYKILSTKRIDFFD